MTETVAIVGQPDFAEAFRRAADAAGSAAAIDEYQEISALASKVAKAAPTYVLVHMGTPDAQLRGALDSLLSALAKQSIPASVLYTRLGDADIRKVIFGSALIDQALEVRSEADLADTFATVLEHLANLAWDANASSEVTEIGTVYVIGDADYRRARTRSLVSHNMGNFNADLRSAVARLKQFPLREELPWDPTDSLPNDRKLQRKDGRWDLDGDIGATPNLEAVMNAFSHSEARDRMKGILPVDSAWHEAWRSKPPLVLLLGESGTGKTLVAETIAELLSPKDGLRFVKVNSAGLTMRSFEHIVHGTAPKTWTGIDEAVVGQLSRAAHGVIFFDEIGDLQPDVQAALLTFLDDRLIRPTGVPPFPGFQHIIAATNRDLAEGANQQWFRNDLLARFTLRLEIPPLRDRTPRELRQLVDFVAQDPSLNPVGHDGRQAVTHITDSTLKAISTMQFRNGNFRELSDLVGDGIRTAMRRYSRVLEGRDLHLEDPHFRSDRDTNRILVDSVYLPEGAAEVQVRSDADLRLLASREGRTVVTDENGRSWVLPARTYYRTE